MDGALLYSALVAVTGSRTARCPGRASAMPWKCPNALTHSLYCREWMWLGNYSSISSPRVSDDQELLKSWHWNSRWWFITMSFIDSVHVEGLIQPGIWAGILLWGSKCVLSLWFAPILNESTSSEQISVACVEGESYSQSASCSNIMSEW